MEASKSFWYARTTGNEMNQQHANVTTLQPQYLVIHTSNPDSNCCRKLGRGKRYRCRAVVVEPSVKLFLK